MAFIKIVSAVVLLVAVSAQQQGGYGGGYGHDEHYAPAHYNFGYAVKDEHTKDIKQHHESREGDKTQGEYSFLEADGTTRTVKYIVDGKSGFVAQVIRSGHAVHAAPVKHVALVQPVHHVAQPVHHVVQAYKPVVVAPVVHQASSYVAGSTFNNGGRRAGGNYNAGGLFRANNNAGFGGYNAGYSSGAASSYSTFSSGAGFGGQRGGFGGNSNFGGNY